MRVWEKNFLITLALFCALFFGSVFAVAATAFSSALGSERETALREEALLAQALQRDIINIEAGENPLPLSVPSLAASYAAPYQRKNIFLQLKQGESVLFGNLPAAVVSPEAKSGGRVCSAITLGSVPYLCVRDTLTGKSTEYSFTYLKDISPLHISLRAQATLLVSLATAVSAAFAALLYITLKKLYRPIDNLAHELRTPLTSIRGYAEYLQTAAASEEERCSAAEYIIGESKRLSEICEKLLALSNVREGEIALEKVDMPALFERVKMAYPNIVTEATERFARGDAALLQSLVMNLVSNAVKAGPEGAPVYLSFKENVLAVRDSGCGMSAAMFARLNKPKYRPAAPDKSGGNGIGVPLCHAIARAHHAQLVFTCAENGGTVARVTFTASQHRDDNTETDALYDDENERRAL